MTNPQPDEPFVADREGRIFDGLEEQVKMFAQIQADSSIFDASEDNSSASAETESLDLLSCRRISTAGWNSKLSSPSQSPEQFDEGDEAYLADPNTEPANVEIAQTEPSDATIGSEQGIPDNEPLKSNSVPDSVENTKATVSNKHDIRKLPKNRQERLITVAVQPKIDPRRRYKSEGKRRIKKQTSNLLTIDLSQMRNYDLKHVTDFWLRLSLITYSNDPQAIRYMHPDVLNYFSKFERLEDGSLCVRITRSHIEQGYIELKDLSIDKTKDNEFTFDLIPYDLKKIHTEWEKYGIDERKTTAGNAKDFRQIYNTASSQIACQIIFQEDQKTQFTYITCKTNVMNEIKYQPKVKDPVKRAGKNKRKSGKKGRKTSKRKGTSKR